MGLNWRLPLADGGLLAAQADEARAQRLKVAGDLADLERQLRVEGLQALAGFRSEVRAGRAAQLLVGDAEAGWRLVNERWRRGVGSHFDLLNAHEALAEARFLAADAGARLLRARWRLAAVGIDDRLMPPN